MRHLADTLLDILEGPDGVRLTAWGFTALIAALGYGTATLFPSAWLAACSVACLIILYIWDAVYDDFIQMAHTLHQPEAIGTPAVFVHLRIAICGALMLIAVGTFLTFAAGRLIEPDIYLFANIAIAFSVPLSFFVEPVRRFHLDALKFGINLPFQVAILALGICVPRSELHAHHTRLNAVARTVFRLITGYQSNLTFLMHTDDILRRLPTRQ